MRLAALWCGASALVVRQQPTRRRLRLAPRMAVTEIAMPALSSTMTSGRVVSWLVGKGDKVEAGDPVMVVESDKADMEVESFEEVLSFNNSAINAKHETLFGQSNKNKHDVVNTYREVEDKLKRGHELHEKIFFFF